VPALDTNRLHQLATVVRQRSFSKAAESLDISQPALSKSIRSLERELGVRLLERGRFGALPTAFGLALARHADAIEAELRIAYDEIEALRCAREGHLRIGCGPSEAIRLLPAALRLLHERAPGVRVTVLYGLNEALMPMVKHGEVDFALSSIPGRSVDSDLRHLLLHEDRAAVIARAAHPLLTQRKPVDAQMLAGQRWILARSEELERRALDELFVQAGLAPPQAEIETTSATLMKTMVMQSDLLTFLPRELVFWEERSGLLRPLRLAAAPWRRLVGVTTRARGSSSPAARSMIEALQRATRELG
jgi:LysR family transcriptional regulator of gallate degradation